MIFVLDARGRFTQARRREPTAPHWNIYYRAQREAPDLVQAMRDTIMDAVQGRMYFDSEKNQFPNSTWIGSRILSSWERKSDWDDYCGDEQTSSALFGEIMWTCMWDDDARWCTTLTTNANEDREERVYFPLREEFQV